MYYTRIIFSSIIFIFYMNNKYMPVIILTILFVDRRIALECEPFEIGLFLHGISHMRSNEGISSWLTRELLIKVAYICV